MCVQLWELEGFSEFLEERDFVSTDCDTCRQNPSVPVCPASETGFGVDFTSRITSTGEGVLAEGPPLYFETPIGGEAEVTIDQSFCTLRRAASTGNPCEQYELYCLFPLSEPDPKGKRSLHKRQTAEVTVRVGIVEAVTTAAAAATTVPATTAAATAAVATTAAATTVPATTAAVATTTAAAATVPATTGPPGCSRAYERCVQTHGCCDANFRCARHATSASCSVGVSNVQASEDFLCIARQ